MTNATPFLDARPLLTTPTKRGGAANFTASGKSHQSVAVIGAGITGITTAYELALQGLSVTVFDRNPDAAMETSFANGGQLSASNAEVWNKWSTIFKGLKWLLDPGAPLSMNLMPNWHKYSWLGEFLLATRHYERNTVDTVKLAMAARAHLLRMAADEGIDFDLEKRGIIHLYRDAKSFASAQRSNALYNQAGLERFAVSPHELCELEPALPDNLLGGFFTPSDMTGDIHKLSVGLARACERRGVSFRWRAGVDGVTPGPKPTVRWTELTSKQSHTDTFDALVVCAGVGSRAIASQLGDRINVYPVKGYSITVNLHQPEDQAAAPWRSLLDDDAKIVTSRLGAGRFRIAGTAEFSGYNRDIRVGRIEPLKRWCETLFPGINQRDVVPWAGLRPMLPNMMPRVGAGAAPGVFYNTGHGHLGWTLSGATANIVAAMVSAPVSD
ncbi:MAG: D-amino acid dehydrogenase [Pseudomonadota bacterium]